MSKTQLKKELKNFDREQLAQLILDLYTSRKETREYLEFFMNPDIVKLTDKYHTAINHELMRGSWRRSKARISTLKNLVKDFESFGVDAEQVIDMRAYVLTQVMLVESIRDLPPTFEKSMPLYVEQTLAYGDAHALFDYTVEKITAVINHPQGSNYYKRMYSKALDNWLQNN